MSKRIIAIDWSGAKDGGAKKIWRADVIDGDLVSLAHGRTRDEVAAQLNDDASANQDLAVGLDFSFSFPAWFLTQHGLTSAQELWRRAAEGWCEPWLSSCASPFWGRQGSRRPRDCDVFRRTEHDCYERTGFRPMSTFQIGGAGAPGTGSLRGMPVLHKLREAGFSVWPFDRPGWPLVFEIYPRALTGTVTKSSATQRAAYVSARYPELRRAFRDAVCVSEDAFDAAVSALQIARHVDEFERLAQQHEDQTALLEGAIWLPDSQLSSNDLSDR